MPGGWADAKQSGNAVYGNWLVTCVGGVSLSQLGDAGKSRQTRYTVQVTCTLAVCPGTITNFMGITESRFIC
jgi:hypothetical protein